MRTPRQKQPAAPEPGDVPPLTRLEAAIWLFEPHLKVTVRPLAGNPGPRPDDQVTSVVVNSACAVVAGVLTALGLAWWKNRRLRPRAADFGLVPSPRSMGVVAAWTAGGYVALSVVGAAYTALVHPAPQDTMQAVRDAEGPQLAALAVLAICLAPVTEELVCRGVLYRALRTRWRPAIAAPISALVFALPHLDPQMLPLQIAAGVVLCVVVERTGSLIPAVMLHSALNAPAVAAQQLLLGAVPEALMLAVCALVLTRPRRDHDQTAYSPDRSIAHPADHADEDAGDDAEGRSAARPAATTESGDAK